MGPLILAAALQISSPNGLVSFSLTTESSRLVYSISLGRDVVIEPSSVGIVVDGANLGDGVEIGRAESYNVDTKYAWYGVHNTAVGRCHGSRIALTHASATTRVRVDRHSR